MNVKLISFSESKILAMNVTHDIISEKIAEIIGKEETFVFCQEQSDLFQELKDGFENYDAILLAVDVSKFVSVKAALFRALGFKCRLDEKIVSLINSDTCMATLNENQIKAHSAIPVGGKAFITNDGLFSGFGMESGGQRFVVVPIDDRRIGFVIENGMQDFLAEGVEEEEPAPEAKDNDIPESMEGYVEPIENFVSDTPTQDMQQNEADEAEESQEENETENDFEDLNSSSYDEGIEYLAAKEVAEGKEDTDVFTEEFSILASRGINISFARIDENTALKNVLARIEKSPVTQFVDLADDESLSDDKRKEFVASNARKAMKETNSDFAIAISRIYEDAEKRYVFATLADAQKSSVFKIFASEEETDEELYFSSIESIIEKIVEVSEDVKATSFGDITSDETIAQGEKKEISLPTKIIIWLLAVIALCTLSALIIDSVMSSANMSEISSDIIGSVGNLWR